MDFVRIVPAARYLGVPAPPHRPYAFYADGESLHGRTTADCYRLVKGLNLPPKPQQVKECRTPFAWSACSPHDLDAPLGAHREWMSDELENTTFLVITVNLAEARKDLDVFPATWRALAFIVSDPGRMGARRLSWQMSVSEFARARIHALFVETHRESGQGLLAERMTKEQLGLTDLHRTSSVEEESEYYHYLSADSAFTNEIVELFGISHRCWHGCGYLGWPDHPLCRFFLLRNELTAAVNVRVMAGRERFEYGPSYV